MKKARFVAAAVIAVPIAFSPIHAQEAVSRPQPAVQPLTIPLPADKPYPATMQLRVDATDVEPSIFHVRQTIPVEQAGRMTPLNPERSPGDWKQVVEGGGVSIRGVFGRCRDNK